jgi:taurine dioxygenase
MEIRPLSPQVGAEVIGVDISQPLPDDVFKTIDDAYNHYSVLVFRGQKLTPEQQIAFSRLFGELEVSPRTQFALPGHPEILVLSNKVKSEIEQWAPVIIKSGMKGSL